MCARRAARRSKLQNKLCTRHPQTVSGYRAAPCPAYTGTRAQFTVRRAPLSPHKYKTRRRTAPATPGATTALAWRSHTPCPRCPGANTRLPQAARALRLHGSPLAAPPLKRTRCRRAARVASRRAAPSASASASASASPSPSPPPPQTAHLAGASRPLEWRPLLARSRRAAPPRRYALALRAFLAFLLGPRSVSGASSSSETAAA